MSAEVKQPVKKSSWPRKRKRVPVSQATVGIRLLDLRRKAGIRKTTEAADQAQVSPTLLHKIEKGIAIKPHRKVEYAQAIGKLAALYGASPEDILTEEQS